MYRIVKIFNQKYMPEMDLNFGPVRFEIPLPCEFNTQEEADQHITYLTLANEQGPGITYEIQEIGIDHV